MNIYPALIQYVNSLNLAEIAAERRAILQKLVDYLKKQISLKKNSALNFICTHNSRRSHLAQVWAQTMAHYYRQPTVSCFSGGTEVTELYHQIIDTLTAVGFNIELLKDGDNPIYHIKYGNGCMPIIAFSKSYDHLFNPSSDFAAILVCDTAAEACPFIAHAEERMNITFKDPKVADDREDKAIHCEAISRQIATELKWVFSNM